MKNIKFRVNSFEDFTTIQEILFENGCKWTCSGKNLISRQNFKMHNYSYCYVDSDKDIINLSGSLERFEAFNLPEVELVQKISYDLKEIPKLKKVVKVGNLSYYEDELAEALKNIKPL